MVRALAFLLLVLLSAAIASSPGSAQQSPPSTDPPQFRSAINFVEVDVIVTGDRQRPLTDLRQDEFELLEDGKAQVIEQFRLVRMDAAAADPLPRPIRSASDEETEAARDDVRLFGIFFDDDSLGEPGGLSGLFRGKEDVERVRAPLIRFVQSRLRPVDMVATMFPTTPLAAIEFTRDREKTTREINRFADGLIDRRDRDLKQRLNQPNVPVDYRRSYNGLHALSAKMAALREGRKSVIYVGRGIANAFSMSPRLGRLDFDELTATLNRSNISVYALDPAGLTLRSGGTRQASLRELAESTGGFAIANTNSMEDGLARVVSDASVYYMLGYTSPAPADGKFHEIKVRVKRPDVIVRGRSGFWAYSAEALKRASTPAKWIASPVMEALGSLSTSADEALTSGRTWVGASRTDDGRPRVTVVWEALAGTRGVRVSAVAIAATNRAGVEVFTDREVVTPGGAPNRAGRPPTGRVAFGTEPGQLQVKVSFEDAAGEIVDSEVQSFVVPDFSSAAPLFSTPHVFRAANAREFGIISADADAVPSVGREFARTDRLLVRFDSYRPGGEPRAAVLNRQGDQMFELPVSRATAGATHQVDLMLNRLTPGEYLIELLSPEPGKRELVAVRVR